MIDLILHCPAGTAALLTWAKTNPPANPLIFEQDDGEGGTVNVNRTGFEYCLWAGSGDFMTAKAVLDVDGETVITPASFLPGTVALVRIYSSFFEDQYIDPAGAADPENPEQWEKNKVAKYIKDNGTLNTIGSPAIPYYELDGVRIFRPQDVNAFLASNSLPGHEWLGGNSY